MDNSPRFVVLLVLLLIIFFTPEQKSVQRFRHNQDEPIKNLRQADFDVLANSTYGTLQEGQVNLTGLSPQSQYQWQSLSTVQELVREQVRKHRQKEDGSLYQTLTADIRGKFHKVAVGVDHSKRINLTSIDPLGGYLTTTFQRNVTDHTGEILISLEDSRSRGSAKAIEARLTLYTSSAPGSGWEANLLGVHLPSGMVILSTASRKFNSLPALPHFSLNEDDYNHSRSVMNTTVTRLWDRSSSVDTPLLAVPSCELVVWLQQLPLTGSTKYIEEIEKELREPDGAPIGTPQPLAFTATIFSPDCGYVLQAEPLFGPKAEAYWIVVRRLIMAFLIIIALQIALLKRQMEKCATPSTRARISYYGIGIAAFGDGLILFAMIGLLMIEGGALLLLAAAAFLCCMHVAFFEVKFIFDIWTVQVGEPAQAERERQRRTNANTITDTTPEGLPLPATAATGTDLSGTAAQIEQTETTTRTTFTSLYMKFYFTLANLTFFSLWTISWPQTLRSAYLNLLAFCYFSLWVPQIYRNIMRNCRKALNWEYVFGTSVLRAIPVLYWYFDDNNVLAATTNPTTALILIAWLWVQLLVMLSQQFLGPRIFVRETWCPPAYDYHPILYDDLEAGGLPIGELASASEGKEKDNKTRKVFDCAICMNEIDVPVISKEENNGRSWLEQRSYMVTPCRHIFHVDCLEGWMNLRLVCPVCREGLPPL